MSIFRICERAIGMMRGNRLILSSSQMKMLEELDYEGLANDHAQEEAVTCARHFDQVRKSLLQQYPFVCARKSAALAQKTDKLPGWRYTYVMPTDCLRPLQFICNGTEITKSKYEIAGRDLGTNAPDVILRYTRDLPDTDDWDNSLDTCFCLSLASEVSLAVMGTPNATEGLTQRFQFAIQEAYRTNSIDEAQGMSIDAEARWGTYSTNYHGHVWNPVDGGMWF